MRSHLSVLIISDPVLITEKPLESQDKGKVTQFERKFLSNGHPKQKEKHFDRAFY